jgi:hypothetical protein
MLACRPHLRGAQVRGMMLGPLLRTLIGGAGPDPNRRLSSELDPKVNKRGPIATTELGDFDRALNTRFSISASTN